MELLWVILGVIGFVWWLVVLVVLPLYVLNLAIKCMQKYLAN